MAQWPQRQGIIQYEQEFEPAAMRKAPTQMNPLQPQPQPLSSQSQQSMQEFGRAIQRVGETLQGMAAVVTRPPAPTPQALEQVSAHLADLHEFHREVRQEVADLDAEMKELRNGLIGVLGAQQELKEICSSRR